MPSELYQIERLIDRHGLSAFLAMVTQICREKAEHVSTNWQDEELALRWSNLGDRIETASNAARTEELV